MHFPPKNPLPNNDVFSPVASERDVAQDGPLDVIFTGSGWSNARVPIENSCPILLVCRKYRNADPSHPELAFRTSTDQAGPGWLGFVKLTSLVGLEVLAVLFSRLPSFRPFTFPPRGCDIWSEFYKIIMVEDGARWGAWSQGSAREGGILFHKSTIKLFPCDIAFVILIWIDPRFFEVFDWLTQIQFSSWTNEK